MKNKITRSIVKNSLALLMLALPAGLILALVYTSSSGPIAEQQRLAQEALLAELFSDASYDNNLLEDRLSLDPQSDNFSNTELLALRETSFAYRLRQRGQMSGIIIPAIARDGYNGDIALLVAIRRNGEISAVRVTRHRETPGLGDKIELPVSDWILGFESRSLENPDSPQWTVKDAGGVFEQFTGATITPRAVTEKIRDVLQFYALNQDQLADL
ncbi:MAG: electron transport complex subunit RsxG [Gammaproteobacteria bacterium]|nr:electron transport complex subunit RsxG [Gammaproteobacteria bacterium]MAY03597.1 electron transport complex subunit RsxG [Gammaproteobacteria bacterium]|tara:strand:+ start:280922 stop:281566 length:645 start_codon:yes stop_codon:yes gene_type:complete